MARERATTERAALAAMQARREAMAAPGVLTIKAPQPEQVLARGPLGLVVNPTVAELLEEQGLVDTREPMLAEQARQVEMLARRVDLEVLEQLTQMTRAPSGAPTGEKDGQPPTRRS